MKLIDLLNKIAKGEEVPKRISVVWTGGIVHDLYQYNDYLKWYETLDETTLMTINDSNDLYCEVEIIEENKKIEKIELYEDSDGHYFYDKHCKKIYITCDEINFMFEQFNDLIDEINKLKEV